MPMFQHALKASAIALALGGATVAQAVTSLSVTLGPPIVDGNTIRMEVSMDFVDTDSSTSGLTFFQLGIAPGTSSTLTNNGTDFSRFSFTPSALLANWGPSPIFDFDSGNLYALGLDTSLFNTGALFELNNPHVVGTIDVLVSGLTPGSAHVVDIVASDLQNFDGTIGGYQPDPAAGDPSSELLVDEVFVTGVQTITVPQGNGQPSVPEPGTLALGLIGFIALSSRRARA